MPQPTLTILYNDDDLVAVEKPAGLATIPGRGETDSLLERLAFELNLPHKGETDPRLRVVHRLDKDTSGVVVFAKNIATQRHLSHQFQNNQIEKEYLALVAGHPSSDEGEIDAAIGPHPNSRTRMAVLKHGRPALTRWKLE
ncbi:MAG TPA: RluA family pseudouridine synthase, partial [Tepidisphaeraceae bacterium]|nr:RluA family pseudouridine synthase [Tepidisphaeraceae bacterium]